jgi:hypothetical protein
VVLSLLYTGSQPFAVPAVFSHNNGITTVVNYPVISATVTGKSTSGACAPKQVVFCPSGKTWDPTTKTCVSTGVVLTTPGPGGAVGGAWHGSGGVGAGTFTRVKGTRGRTLVEASGALPAAYLGMTPAGMQAILNASFPGQYSNVAVVYPTATSLQVDYDYCGPTATVPSPGSVTDGAVTLTSTFSQIGTATSCGSSSMSKGTKIALGVGGGVVAAGAAWAGYRLYKGKSILPKL